MPDPVFPGTEQSDGTPQKAPSVFRDERGAEVHTTDAWGPEMNEPDGRTDEMEAVVRVLAGWRPWMHDGGVSNDKPTLSDAARAVIAALDEVRAAGRTDDPAPMSVEDDERAAEREWEAYQRRFGAGRTATDKELIGRPSQSPYQFAGDGQWVRLQRAVDVAYAAMRGSEYVGGPTEREAWQTALAALGEVVTQHKGQGAAPKETPDA